MSRSKRSDDFQTRFDFEVSGDPDDTSEPQSGLVELICEVEVRMDEADIDAAMRAAEEEKERALYWREHWLHSRSEWRSDHHGYRWCGYVDRSREGEYRAEVMCTTICSPALPPYKAPSTFASMADGMRWCEQILWKLNHGEEI